jgi:hypothetical protein
LYFAGLQIFPVMIKIALRFSVEEAHGSDPVSSGPDFGRIASLSLDDQEMLIKIIKQRHIERQREQILKDSRETMRAYKKGAAKRGTVDNLMRDLESD